MTEIIDQVLPNLSAAQLPGLKLSGDFLLPAYDGHSLLNLPATICELLGIPPFGAPPLSPEHLQGINQGYRNVIFLVVDGLGLDRFRGLIGDDSFFWSRHLSEAMLSPITSVVPSTTSAALTTLWTGASPAQHGILGYELWLKEYGVVANMISQAVMTATGDPNGLRRSGFNPENFLPVPTLGPHLQHYGVQPVSAMPAHLARSGLSTMHLPATGLIAYRSPVDLWSSLGEFVVDHPSERNYLYVYWEELDTLAHVYGPDNYRIDNEFASFTQAFEKLFLNRLGLNSLKDTLLILTADHGLVDTRIDPIYELRSIPELANLLHIFPTGENRFSYLYPRPGNMETVQRLIDEHWPGGFEVIPSQAALQAGLFGPGSPSIHTFSRIGDFVCLAHGKHYLWWSDKQNHLIGRHGGLSPKEMLVPFYVLPLG